MRRHATFGNIDFGEDDANIEFELSQHSGHPPLFIQAFVQHPNINIEDFRSGHKYLILGQKGTGKTAILRKLQRDAEEAGLRTQFLVFRDEVASREELDKLGDIFAVNVNEVKRIQHHLYTLERLILLTIASKLRKIGEVSSLTTSDADTLPIWNLLKSVAGKAMGVVVDTTIESVSVISKTVDVDLGKLTRNVVNVDAVGVLRRQNELLKKYCIESLNASGDGLQVFVDEIHFTYRAGQDHDQDASLVRDLVKTVKDLNKTFREHKVRCKILVAIRSEFLSHPLISQAELHSVLSAYGVEISWATFPANLAHPMFEIGARRADVAISARFTGQDFMKACFANFTVEKAEDFVRSTWSKPRDMIRFLKTCREMFADRTTLSDAQYKAVFHRSCFLAWKEIEIALTSFLTVRGIEKLKTIVAGQSSKSLENGYVGSYKDFLQIIKPVVKADMQTGALSDEQQLFRILYMIGVVYTTRQSKSGQVILHSFHRGQENADLEGNVALHRGVAKAFS